MRVGLGSDVAGGYSADVMSAMRWAVGVSRMREGVRTEQTRAKGQQGEEVWDGGGRRGVRGAEEVEVDEEVKIDWREAMYMATRGGAEALGLDCGVFKVGAPFDAQCSTSVASHLHMRSCSFFLRLAFETTIVVAPCSPSV